MTRMITGAIAVAVLAVGGFALMNQGASNSGVPVNPLIGSAEAQSGDVDTSSIVEMVQGNEDASVTLIEYASYTCPHCANFHEGPYKQLKADFIDTGKIKFVYREVYFDRYGLWASMVARCSGPDKFFGITDLIFKGQSDWTKAGGASEIVDELRKIGRLAGIENESLEACLQDGDKAQTLVAWYQENAQRDGVESTPSFLLNGEMIKNQPYGDLKTLIEAELDN
jgi:protein-disulfide isomerase